jgi:hypothetical protein
MAFRPYVNMGQQVQFRYDPYASFLTFASPCYQFPQLNMTIPWQDVSSQIRGTTLTAIPPFLTSISGSATPGPAAIEPIQVGYRGNTLANTTGCLANVLDTNLKFPGTTLFTIETYVRWNSGPTPGRMLYTDYAGGNVTQSAILWRCYTTANTMDVYIDSGTSTETLIMSVSVPMTVGQWYHIVFQRSATGRWQIFQDGVLRGTSTSTVSPNTTTTSRATLGNYGTGASGTDTGAVQAQFQDYKVYRGIGKYGTAATSVGTTYFTPPPSMIIAP